MAILAPPLRKQRGIGGVPRREFIMPVRETGREYVAVKVNYHGQGGAGPARSGRQQWFAHYHYITFAPPRHPQMWVL